MLWLILSLLTALAVAPQDAWVKKHFSHLTAYDMLAFPFLFSLPLFAVTVPFIPVPPLDDTFYTDRHYLRQAVFQRKICCRSICGCRSDGGRRGADYDLGKIKKVGVVEQWSIHFVTPWRDYGATGWSVGI
jgi:hypothetical protein